MEASLAANIIRDVSIILVIIILVIIIIIIITGHFSSQVIHRIAVSLPKSQILVSIKNKKKHADGKNADNNGRITIIE